MVSATTFKTDFMLLGCARVSTYDQMFVHEAGAARKGRGVADPAGPAQTLA